jgi:hypothetical protein
LCILAVLCEEMRPQMIENMNEPNEKV